MANELNFAVKVDLSGLNSGFAAATATVKTGAADMSAAMAAAKAATQNLSEAMIALGPAAAGGNAQAQAAIADYTAAAGRAQAAVAALTSAEAAETTVLRSSVSERMAATASLRTLEGGITGSTRAAGAFLTMLPGVGVALQAAFPVIGALALGEVIVDVGEKLAKAFDLGGERARAVQHDIEGVTNALDHSSTALDVQIDRLQQEQAKLEKRPFNGMKLVLDEAAESAQNLAMRLDSVIEREGKAIAGMSASLLQKVFLGQTGTDDEQHMLEEHNKWLDRAKNIQEQINESTSFGNALQDHLLSLKEKQAENERYIESAAQSGSSYAGTDYSKNIEATQEALRYQQQELTVMQKTVDLGKAQADTQGARDAHHIGPDPNIQKLRDIETAFAQMNTKLPEAALRFWSSYNGAFKQGSSEYLHVLEQVDRYTNEFNRKLTTSSRIRSELAKEQHYESPQGADEAILKVNKLVQEGAEDTQQAGEKWRGYWTEVSRGQQISTQNASALQQANIAAQLASGGVTKLTADHELATVRSQAFKDRISELTDELVKLEAAYAKLPKDPMTGAVQGGGEVQGQIQGVKNQIATTQGQAAVSAITDNTKITSDITAPFKSAFDTVNNDWLQMQNKLIFGTHNVGRAFANMGVSILESSAAWAEKWLAKQAQTYLADQVLHLVATTHKATVDSVAAAKSIAAKTTEVAYENSSLTEMVAAQTAASAAITGIKSASALTAQTVTSAANVAAATSYAAVAAAGAAAAVAFVPLVGPALAPAAAAATFASTAPYVALAAFETGGIIPNTGIAMVHQGEAVIPANLTQLLMSTANNSSTSNSSSSAMTMNFHGGSDEMFRRQIQRNGKALVKSVQRGMRDMGKA